MSLTQEVSLDASLKKFNASRTNFSPLDITFPKQAGLLEKTGNQLATLGQGVEYPSGQARMLHSTYLLSSHCCFPARILSSSILSPLSVLEALAKIAYHRHR